MKRFLNECRTFIVEQVVPDSNESPDGTTDFIDDFEKDYLVDFRYRLANGNTPEENELFLGEESNSNFKGLFLHKSGEIYSLSYDDFSYDFLSRESNRLNGAYIILATDINSISEVSSISEDIKV